MTTPTECKHGLKHGCVYCHVTTTSNSGTRSSARTGSKRPSRSTKLAEQMNDRMTKLKKRLREIRGENPSS